MAETVQTLNYQRPSTLGADRLDLAAAGGTAGLYVDSFLQQPRQAATGLLLCGTVARSRFSDPEAARNRDPVLTAHDDRLRMESFSSCCSLYARYDVLPDGLETPPTARGTTNVDINDGMRDALTRVRDGDPLHLLIGAEGLRASTLDATVTERKVPLPRRWLGERQARAVVERARRDERGGRGRDAVGRPGHRRTSPVRWDLPLPRLSRAVTPRWHVVRLDGGTGAGLPHRPPQPPEGRRPTVPR